MINYKNYLMSKHLYSCVFHFLRFKNFSKTDSLFSRINNSSLTGNLFFEEKDKTYFKIAINKAPVFLFYDTRKIVGVDVALSPRYNAANLIPHFILLHSSFDPEEKMFREKFKENHKKNIDEILGNVSENETISSQTVKDLLNKNVHYIMCFDNDTQYCNLSNIDYLSIKMVAMEKEQSFGYTTGNQLHKIIFNHILSASGYENEIKRDITITNMLLYLSTHKINDIKFQLTKKDDEIVDELLINKIVSILSFSINEDNDFFQSFFKSCYRNQLMNDNIIEKLYLFIIHHDSFFKYFDLDKPSHKEVIRKRKSLLEKHIEFLISEVKTLIDIDKVLSDILLINPSINVRKIKNKMKKSIK